MEFISTNLSDIKSNIINNKVNDDITLIAVTKTVDIDKIEYAIKEGITDVGENKPQELARKYDIIGSKVRWHLIGSLQTNKVRHIIDKVDMIHSLDRISLCDEIQKRASKINKTINCLVQVNVSKEESKHGLDIDEVLEFIKEVSSTYENIKIKGLMTMAQNTDNEHDVRSVFKELKELSEKVNALNLDNVEMKHLSMGMSNDYKIALQEGATMVRIGSSIFGKRNY